jgi:DIS3-like exonuclease 2
MLLATKPMQLATYFCTHIAPDPLDWRHYALAVGHYTHFTSPIRWVMQLPLFPLFDALWLLASLVRGQGQRQE